MPIATVRYELPWSAYWSEPAPANRVTPTAPRSPTPTPLHPVEQQSGLGRLFGGVRLCQIAQKGPVGHLRDPGPPALPFDPCATSGRPSRYRPWDECRRWRAVEAAATVVVAGGR
jgi:hypothetical protein